MFRNHCLHFWCQYLVVPIPRALSPKVLKVFRCSQANSKIVLKMYKIVQKWAYSYATVWILFHTTSRVTRKAYGPDWKYTYKKVNYSCDAKWVILLTLLEIRIKRFQNTCHRLCHSHFRTKQLPPPRTRYIFNDRIFYHKSFQLWLFGFLLGAVNRLIFEKNIKS